MKDIVKRGLLISDFNIENLAAYLNRDAGEPQVNCTVAPYGQVTQSLLDATHPFWEPKSDFLVVWSRPESVLESFSSLLAGFNADEEKLKKEVHWHPIAV